jgi:hypothetical protein
MHIQRGCRKAALFDYWVLSTDVAKDEKGLILQV